MDKLTGFNCKWQRMFSLSVAPGQAWGQAVLTGGSFIFILTPKSAMGEFLVTKTPLACYLDVVLSKNIGHQRGERMMPQTVLPFKLEKTKERITANAGLALLGEFCEGIGFGKLLDKKLPKPGSAVGYTPGAYVTPLILMLNGGGQALEDLREIRNDAALRELLGLDEMPSSDATGDWLRRMGLGKGLSRLAEVNQELVRMGLERDGFSEYTLDIDATQIVAQKRDARLTYKGERGYMPIVGHLAENGLAIADEFRAGNESPGSGNIEFIMHCTSRMPRGKRVAHLRSDSAAYQASIFNWCDDNSVSFAIGADLDRAVVETIGAMGKDEWRPWGDAQIAETVHCMNNTRAAFRLIVIRRPSQGNLFAAGEPGERYTVIASNREESAEETVAWYNKRGDTSENRIKELKIGFAMERMPCGEQTANAVFFRIGVIAYNLFVLMKMIALPADWAQHQVQTVRWRFFHTAGKVVSHAGSLILKVGEWMFSLFEEVRVRCKQFAEALTPGREMARARFA